MSRKTKTVLVYGVKIVAPSGANAQQVRQYIKEAIVGWGGASSPDDPMFGLEAEQVTIALQRKEVIYG